MTLADTVITLLSEKQPESCRKLLNSLFDDCLGLRKDQRDQDESKQLDTDSLVRRIIQISATFDRKLAQSFLEKYAAVDSLELGQESTRARTTSLMKFYMTTAPQLVQRDPALAASIAEKSGFSSIIPETFVFLTTLRQRDAVTSNRLFLSALRAVQLRGGRDANELLMLFSFVFAPQQIPMVTPQGLGVYILPNGASLRDYPADLGLA